MSKKLIAAFLCATALCSCSNDDDDNTMNQTDRDFITNASLSNNAEVDAGQVASSKASHSAVMMFGHMMVADHTTAQNELRQISQQMGQNAPQGLDSMHQMMHQYLSGLSGHTFDTAYMRSQVQDHQTAMSIMQREISNGNDSRLRDYANKYLPKIQDHYHMADSIYNSIR